MAPSQCGREWAVPQRYGQGASFLVYLEGGDRLVYSCDLDGGVNTVSADSHEVTALGRETD